MKGILTGWDFFVFTLIAFLFETISCIPFIQDRVANVVTNPVFTSDEINNKYRVPFWFNSGIRASFHQQMLTSSSHSSSMATASIASF